MLSFLFISSVLAEDSSNLLLEEVETMTTTFQSQIESIPSELREKMIGVTWHEGCPVPIDDLSLISMSYWGEDKQTHSGQLIIHKDHAEAVVRIFDTLYTNQFPCTSMKLMGIWRE